MRVQLPRLATIGLFAAASLSYAAIAQAAPEVKKVTPPPAANTKATPPPADAKKPPAADAKKVVPPVADAATKVADHLVAMIATSSDNSKATYTKATMSGSDVVVTGFKVTNKRGTMEVPNLVLTAPTPRSQGGYTATKMTFDKGKAVNDGTTIAWTTASFDNLLFPSIDEIKAKTRTTPFQKMSMAGMTITGGEAKVPVTIANTSVVVGNIADGVPHDAKINIDGIVLPAALFNDPKYKSQLAQLGYTDGFTGSIAIDGSYANDTDTATLRSLSVAADKVGKITIAGTTSGTPLSKVADSSKASEVLTTALMKTGSVRFDNAGVVERILDSFAKATGADRKTFVATTVGALPLLLGQYITNQAFRNKVAAAATTFLNDPKSLTLTSAPANPVPAMQVLGAAFNAPQTLPDVLTLDISANK